MGEPTTTGGLTTVRLITVVLRDDGALLRTGARAAEERPPARPPLLAAMTWELPKSASSMANAGATVATFDMRNAAATKEVAAFFIPSSLIMPRAVVSKGLVEEIVANPDTLDAHNSARRDLVNFMVLLFFMQSSRIRLTFCSLFVMNVGKVPAGVEDGDTSTRLCVCGIIDEGMRKAKTRHQCRLRRVITTFYLVTL